MERVDQSITPSVQEQQGLAGLQGILTGQRRRVLKEYLTGYLMILPSSLLIFLFGIFPVFFALYVSVHKWRLKRGDIIGIENYLRALDNLAYVALFAIGVLALIGAAYLVVRLIRLARDHQERPWLLAIPGLMFASMLTAFFGWFVLLLPEVLDIANKIIGVEKTRQLFIDLLIAAFRSEPAFTAFQIFGILLFASIILGAIALKLYPSPRNAVYQSQFTMIFLAVLIGVLLIWYMFSEVASAYQVALETGTDPGIWPQVITISSGLILLALAWIIWRSADRSSSTLSFWLRLMAAFFLMLAAWMMITVLPTVMAAGDEDMWEGLKVTIFYSLGTVPFQLSISMFLAILLFQKLAGSELFRMIFFLPYVTPFVASAAVFRQMFSIRPQAPVNQFIGLFGIESLGWIQEPKGVFTMLGSSLGIEVPGWASGPSLALIVIMLYSIWVFVGYDTVIYLAGLGNISTELIEAAQIDGAGRWDVFRHIIFPLLSPTTYFLSLLAIIGTFKAFSHIWVLRHELALGTTNTFSVTIFLEFFDKVRYGYASALAFVLFAIILSLTVINNRIQGTRVFYG